MNNWMVLCERTRVRTAITKRKLVDDKIGHNQLLLRALTRVNSDEIGLPTVPPFPKFVSSPVKLKRRKMILPVLSVFCHCGSSNAQGDDMFSCVTGAIPSLRLLLHNWWKSPLAKQMEPGRKDIFTVWWPERFDRKVQLLVTRSPPAKYNWDPKHPKRGKESGTTSPREKTERERTLWRVCGLPMRTRFKGCKERLDAFQLIIHP